MIKPLPKIEPLEQRIAPAFAAVIDLANLEDGTGFRIDGAAAGENAGTWVSSGADVNGDGVEDVLIAGIGGRANGSLSGTAYVLFGSETRAASFDLASINGSNGFKINGVASGDRLSFINSAGDVNGDGIDDILIGAWGAAANGAYSGAAYVIFGKRDGFTSTVNLSQLNGTNGFKISGEAANDNLGASSPAGDINGDGFDDLILGARGADPNGSLSGAAYVVFGKASGFLANLNLSTLNGTNGFKIRGEAAGDALGQAVSAAGDVNGDGFDDFIVGAGGADPSDRYEGGAAYIVFGKGTPFTSSLSLSSLNGTNGFKFTGISDNARIGSALAQADVNGDGFDDVIIGAPVNSYNGIRYVGSTFVVFGKAAGFPSVLSSAALNGPNGFTLNGVAFRDQTGVSVSGGDVNGDGFDDIIVGASDADPKGTTTGLTYVVYGKEAGFSPSLHLDALNGSNGFKIIGAAEGDSSGISVSAVGDVNGDGANDLLIGSRYATINGREKSGAAYVIFGEIPLTISVADAMATEGSDLAFLVSLSRTSNEPVSVKVRTAGGSAVAGDDFVSIDGATVTFAPGETEKTVLVRSLDDALYEGAEKVNLLLSESQGAAILKVIGNGSILDNDVAPGVSIDDPAVFEGDAGTGLVVFTVSLTEPSGLPAIVQWATANGTATAGADYTSVSGSITFAPGEMSKTISVSVQADSLYEADENFAVVLSNAFGGVLQKASGTATIRNDDLPPALSVAAVSVREGDSGSTSLVFTVELSASSGMPVTVGYATEDVTAFAGTDYTAIDLGQLTFAPGETSKTIAVEILGDLVVEAHETFSLVVSGASGATIQSGIATGTILNDDAVLSIDSRGIREMGQGTTPLTFAVSIDQPSALPITFTYASADGTASGGADYEIVPPTQVTIAPGETFTTITILVNGDSEVEDHETFSIVLSNPEGATIGTGTGVGTIMNDDTRLWINDAQSVIEGNVGTAFAVFEATLEKPSVVPVSIRYTIRDETAFAGSDFIYPDDTSFTFAPGETSKKILVEVLGDTSVEAHETFSAVILFAGNATIGRDTALGAILNDDTLIRIDDGSVLEGHDGAGTITFNVSLSAESALPVSVNYTTADVTATSGLDYLALLPGTLNFAPGEVSKSIVVEVFGDVETEASEALSVLLSDAINAGVEDSIGEGTILNDDVALLGKRKATYTDVDGDIVTIRVNKGVLKVEDFTLIPAGSGSQLALVDFSGEAEFSGANLSITAKRAPGAEKGARTVDVGYIDAGGIDLGKVTIKGDLGRIHVGSGLEAKSGLQSLSAASVGLHGLATQLPGGLLVSEIAGTLKRGNIGGDVIDATISVSGDIGSLKIQGAVLGGRIVSDGRIGELKISGDLSGTVDLAALVSARGILAPASAAKANAIGAISIGGTVEHAQILAGYDRTGAAVNPDAGIKTVKVSGNWTASDLVAGAVAGDDDVFGTADDLLIPDDSPVIARIASIQIKGAASGLLGGARQYGLVAEHIAALKIAGTKVPLVSGPSNDIDGVAIGSTGDLWVREVGGAG